MKATRRLGVLVLLLSLVGAACGGNGSKTGGTAELTTLPPITEAPTGTSTTSPPDTTTTIVADGSPSFLNGMPVADETLQNRRVVAVKVDNHPDARPQSGIEDAGAVIELLVEAGITRFIGLFHDTDTEYIGPIRSGRPTDPTLLVPLGATFQISGAQPWVLSIIAGAGIRTLGETSPNTFRIPRGGRAYERTLYGSTLGIREVADTRGLSDDPPPGPWLLFGDEPAAHEGEAAEIELSWSGDWPVVRWSWDGEQYLRFNGDTPHEWVGPPVQESDDGDESTPERDQAQISVDTLLVLFADRYTASPPAGAGGSSVPALRTTGTNRALLFYEGGVVDGTWERAETDDFFTVLTAEGDEMTLPAGRLWVSVFPDDRPVTWE